MRKAVGIFRITVMESRIPATLLISCFQILCAIGNAVPDLSAMTYESVMLLLRASVVDAAEVLLETVALPPQDRHSHTVCGALAVLSDLVILGGQNSLPTIAFEQFITALAGVHFASRRIRISSLKAIANVLGASDLTKQILGCDWSGTVDAILRATGDSVHIQEKPSSQPSTRAFSHPGSRSTNELENSPSGADRKLTEEITAELKRIAQYFSQLWPRLDTTQRASVATFYQALSSALPTDSLMDIIDAMGGEGGYQPCPPDWVITQGHMLGLFKATRDTASRCHILTILNLTIKAAQEHNELPQYRETVRELLMDYGNHKDVTIANLLVVFVVNTWKASWVTEISDDIEMLSCYLEQMVTTTRPASRTLAGAGASEVEESPNLVSRSLVSLFLHLLQLNSKSVGQMYDLLIKFSKDKTLSASIRLPVLRLMMRLRCDQNNAIMVVACADSLGLAALLQRSEPAGNDRTSTQDNGASQRAKRASTIGQANQNTLRANPRSSVGNERGPSQPSTTTPLWIYSAEDPLPDPAPQYPSRYIYQHTENAVTNKKMTINVSEWLVVAIEILQGAEEDWEVYTYVLVHLPSQLSNATLFANALPYIRHLRAKIVEQLQQGSFREPPSDSGVRKGDIALCLMHSLIMLLGYSDHFARNEQEDIVRTFLVGINNWDRTAKTCIQTLTISCYILPGAVTRSLNGIIQKLSQMITQSHLAMDILEFLAGLARLPAIYVNFREDEYRTIFAVCTQYLEHSRNQRLNRTSGVSARSGLLPEGPDVQKDLPQYVYALAYHVMTIWFLSLKLVDRSKHVGWITERLALNGTMEEQAWVTLDMMHRTAYLDLGETKPDYTMFTEKDGKILKKSWLVGMSVITLETASGSGLTQITKRQASGTTYASFRPQTAQLPPHHIPMQPDILSSFQGPDARINVFPSHVFLQLTSTIAPSPGPMEPICLPDDDGKVDKSLELFDLNSTVDGYKVGIIYVGNGQKQETEILANTDGSPAFDQFLEAIGTKVALKGALFNTQGLDKERDGDGTHTYAWRDRVAEIIFHVPTMMPNDATDPQQVRKKSHIGNDFVNIIFNESGMPFRFNTFPSDWNYVNIVITPFDSVAPRDNASIPANASAPCTTTQIKDEATGEIRDFQQCFTVQTVSHPSFPSISPTASYKLVPLSCLGPLVRQLALNSSVFSNVWANRTGDMHVSSWRNRFREIGHLRKKYSNTGTSTSTQFPGAKSIKTYAHGDNFKGRVEMGGLAEEEGILATLDFSRWAGPNPQLK